MRYVDENGKIYTVDDDISQGDASAAVGKPLKPYRPPVQYQTGEGQMLQADPGITQQEAQSATGQPLVPVQTTEGMDLGERLWRLPETGFRQLGAAVAGLPHAFNDWMAESVGKDDPTIQGDYKGEKYMPLSPEDKLRAASAPWWAQPKQTKTAEYEKFLADKVAARKSEYGYNLVANNTPTMQEGRSKLAELFGAETAPLEASGRIYQKAIPAVAVGAATGGAGAGLVGAAEGGAAGLTSTLAGEGVREAGGPESLAVAAELLGGGVPALMRTGAGAAMNLARASTPNAARLMREAVESSGASPQQFSDAVAAMRAAREASPNTGSNVTMDEALNDVTSGSASRLAGIRRVVEGESPEMKAMMANRPGFANEGVTDLAQGIETTPLNGGPVPLMDDAASQSLPRRLREAGTDIQQNAQDWKTLQSSPLYRISDAARVLRTPADLRAFQDLLQRPSMQRAWRITQDVTADAGGPQSRMFNSSIGIRIPNGKEIDIMKKDFDRAISILNRRGDHDGAFAVGQARRELLGFVDPRSPEYAAARASNRAAGQQIRDVNQSPAAQLGPEPGMGHNGGPPMTPEDSFSEAVRAMFPNKPGVTGEETAADLLRLLRGDPQTTMYRPGGVNSTPRPGGGVRALRPEAQQLVSKFLSQKLDEASKLPAALGSNIQRQGAAFHALTMGNPQQRANLLAQIEAIAGPEARTRAETLGNIFRQQGFRPNEGSPTNFNAMVTKSLQNAGVTGLVADVAQAGGSAATGGAIKAGFDAIRQRLADRVYRLNSQQFADWLSDERLAAQWQQVARQPPGSEQAARLLAAMLPTPVNESIDDAKARTKAKAAQ